MKHGNDLRAKEESVLLEANFEPLEEGLLWKRDGDYYGREAALQGALHALRE